MTSLKTIARMDAAVIKDFHNGRWEPRQAYRLPEGGGIPLRHALECHRQEYDRKHGQGAWQRRVDEDWNKS